MKQTLLKHVVMASFGAAIVLSGCKTNSATELTAQGSPSAPPPTSSAVPGQGANAARMGAGPAMSPPMAGTVAETMNAGRYTYVLLDTASQKIWAAAHQIAVKVGDKVSLSSGTVMENFHSERLNRDFDEILFVPAITLADKTASKAGTAATAPATASPGVVQAKADMQQQGHPSVKRAADSVDLSGIKKAEGGRTIAEILSSKAELSGKAVKVRAKVVKVSRQIMGKNWLHLQDGTKNGTENDLTITTDALPAVGDTVLVTGVLSTDKDFGYGYKYSAIIENAKVEVESSAQVEKSNATKKPALPKKKG